MLREKLVLQIKYENGMKLQECRFYALPANLEYCILFS